MNRNKAVEILRGDGPKDARALLKEKLKEAADQYWLFLGRLQRETGEWRTCDDDWTVVAVCKETLQPYSNSGTLGHLESIGSLKVEDTVSEHGYAHQHMTGLWVWFVDQRAASPNA